MKLPDWLFVAIGALLGTLLRYSIWSIPVISSLWSTFIVNMLGSFLLAALYRTLELHTKNAEIAKRYKLFFGVGMLGSFTTFSAIGLEALQFLQKGHILSAGLYIFITIILGVIFAWIGYKLPDLNQGTKEEYHK